MEATRSIDELSGSELLDRVDDLAARQRRCEVEILKAAVQHAVINNPNTLDPELTRLPGRERAVRYGGVRTPSAAQFCCAELGGRLGVSPGSAHALIADGLDLVIRLPRLWARVESLEVKVSYARFVARRTRELPIEQADHVDERVAESADGRIPWSRFEELVGAAIAAADPAAAAEREAKAAEHGYARANRAAENGMRGFYIRAPFQIIARLDAVVQYLADALATLGDGEDNDARRVKAILILTHPGEATRILAAFQAWKDRPEDPEPPTEPAGPADQRPDPHPAPREGEQPEVDWAKLLPAVQVFVHMYFPTPDAPSDRIVRVEGIGPLTEQYVKTHLSDSARVTVRPVLDLAGQAPVDAYEIPDRHRQAVHLMTPADTFPYAPNLSRGKQIDHTDPYRPGAADGAGQSRIGNYGPMTGFHHRIKTHSDWDVKQPFPGVYVWRDPHGAMYLVDHTGTRRLWETSASPAEIYLSRVMLDLTA